MRQDHPHRVRLGRIEVGEGHGKAIGGLSVKVLSPVLKELERDGLVTRSVFPTVPVTVEYDLTPLGRTLALPLDALSQRAGKNIDAIHNAQQQYDADD